MAKKAKMRGLSGVVVAILLTIVSIVAVAFFWATFQGKFLTPLQSADIQPDYQNTVLTGKYGNIVFKIAASGYTVTVESISVIDPRTGQEANCQITSESKNLPSGAVVSAKCNPPGNYFVAGQKYVVQVTLVNDNTGQKFVKSFDVTAT
ncbi:MAG: hypothetical protein QXF04_02420 [Candidatus Aenigmatarchaeota archaeon]